DHRATDEGGVKIEAMARVLLDSLPLAPLVTESRPPRDVAELVEVALERAQDGGGAPCRVTLVRHGQRRARSRGEGGPTWMWAPDVWPGTMPHAAMNGIPFARREAMRARPSGLSG